MVLKRTRNDEFYTTYDSIDNIYKTGHIDLNYFKDKKIYCNCDDYRTSNYVRWWKDNFKEIGIKHLTATNYDNGDGAYIYNYDGENEYVDKGIGDGSFEHYDYIIDNETIISTNPPFSKSRDYYNFLYITNAKYYIHNTILNTVKFCKNLDLTYFNRTPSNMVIYDVPSWNKNNVCVNASGITSNVRFVDTYSKVELTKTFDDIKHDFYYEEDIYIRHDFNNDNWHGKILNIDKIRNIPIDYDDYMGVPISFIYINNKYRDMFKIYNVILYGDKFVRIRIKRR